jgi:hypothetical protein
VGADRDVVMVTDRSEIVQIRFNETQRGFGDVFGNLVSELVKSTLCQVVERSAVADAWPNKHAIESLWTSLDIDLGRR